MRRADADSKEARTIGGGWSVEVPAVATAEVDDGIIVKAA